MARVPPSLTSIPHEILDHVVSFLTTQDTAHLARTTRYLKVKLELSLYRNINIVWPLYGDGCRKIDRDPLPPLRSLLQRLLEAPRLVEVVQSINIRTTKIEGHPEAYFMPNSIIRRRSRPRTEVTTLHKNAIRAAGLRDPVKWVVELNTNNFDAYLALILSLCRNIQSIEIGTGLLWNNRLLPEMFESMVAMHTANGDANYQLFPQLQFLDLGETSRRICWEEGSPYFSEPGLYQRYPKIDWYLSLLRAKRLVHIRLALCWSFIKTSDPRLVKNQHLTYVKSLCLVLGPYSPGNLKWLLARVPSLKKLEYDQAALSTMKESLNRYDTIQDNLLVVKDSLEHLRLTVCSWYHPTLPPVAHPPASFSSLSHTPLNFKPLCHLRTLHISLASLSGIPLSIFIYENLSERDFIVLNRQIFDPTFWHCLPESLEHLVLFERNWYKSFREEHWSMGEFLLMTLTVILLNQDWRAVTPHLQRIDVDASANKNIFLPEEERDFVLVCEDQGLACNFIDSSVQWDKL
ncbi:hypothetical protein BU24DRAFT_472619 [Aaosphaeria arxii CBS 175.79]|uniref:F-box domain-containing protein n=1 Tax=Aaosphaeria arxii CBS 175.79 TaxID=1450172 RepID=A0A6A5XCD3_9PLEO|nr:uncharacterized protein BU24DRAFT_472619 [Aaosphaeria arxii CBS 175.79]KAF2010434.1 hypothetical protein BU24DRAFT_472619 [Aaosphaeria arxii CBS 175.79]